MKVIKRKIVKALLLSMLRKDLGILLLVLGSTTLKTEENKNFLKSIFSKTTLNTFVHVL